MTLAYLQYLSYPEIRLVLTLIAAALSAFGFFWNIPRISRALHWLDHRKILCGCLIFILSFAITALLALERGLPLPFVHDEFSYLLQADTFAQGRLSNPTPPASDHFETMHLLVRPTYQSKYPPGQAIFMAMGQVFFGQPIVGVWLSTALAAAALWWAVRAFVPGKWAFLGALIACAHPQVFEWGEQYWGGNVALLAGALLTGAMGRFSKYPSPKLAAIAGLGAFLLSITRPYEGLVITLLLGLLTLLFLRKSHIPYRSILKAVAAFFLVFVPGMLWLGYYNFRVTGHALRLPYMEHQSQYGAAPLFIFQPIKPESLFPKYNNPQLLQFAKDSNAKHLQAKTFSSLLNKWSDELVIMEQTFFGNIEGICILLLFLPVAFKHRQTPEVDGHRPGCIWGNAVAGDVHVRALHGAGRGADARPHPPLGLLDVEKRGQRRPAHDPRRHRRRGHQLRLLLDRLLRMDLQTRQLARNPHPLVCLARLRRQRFPG